MNTTTKQMDDGLSVEELKKAMKDMYHIRMEYSEILRKGNANNPDYFYEKIAEVEPFEQEIRNYLREEKLF